VLLLELWVLRTAPTVARLPVGLGHTLNLILLLDGVTAAQHSTAHSNPKQTQSAPSASHAQHLETPALLLKNAAAATGSCAITAAHADCPGFCCKP
jgi:hypothetical protein